MLSSASGTLRPGYYKFPAISVPTETKDMLELPRSHKAEMEKAIKNTAYLLSIGWRAEEKHFLKLWGSPENQKMLKKIEVINSKEQNVHNIIYYTVKYGKIISPDITIYSRGFSNFVIDGFSSFLEDIEVCLN